MTSGAIQHGVPTNVLRTLFRVMSPPVARKALTPKSRGWENATNLKDSKQRVGKNRPLMHKYTETKQQQSTVNDAENEVAEISICLHLISVTGDNGWIVAFSFG